MRRHELRREAFLGEMVVGHKSAESYKTPLFFFPRGNYENIRENRGNTVGKTYVKYVQSNVNMFCFRKFEFLANYENIR